MCLCVPMRHDACLRVTENMMELALSFHHMGCRDPTQVVRFGDRHVDRLSQLDDPRFNFQRERRSVRGRVDGRADKWLEGRSAINAMELET